ncbi:MAG: 3'-5' exonuclease [Chitinophagales bacterium]
MPDFKFSLPAITALYPDQQLAYNPRQPILVTGGPGSGKTVVTIFRFLRPVRENKDILLFTFNRTLIYSIRGTLRERAEELFGNFDEKKIEEIVEKNLATFFKWHSDNIGWFNAQENETIVGNNFQNFINTTRNRIKFSEIFFDEGQDLPPSIYANAFKLATSVSVGADKAQNYQGHYPPDAVEDIINEKLNAQSPSLWQYLGGNFRNTKEIFDLAKKFVPNDLRVQGMDTSRLRSGNTPEIEIGFNAIRQFEYIKQIIERNPNSNIGILVHFGNKVIEIKEYLERQGFSCANNAPNGRSFSYYKNGMNAIDESVMMKKLKTPFVTTFDSCKGLEFDIVIMPYFEQSDWAMANTNNDGRPYSTRNHYYVAVTRAKNDIFILCDSKPNVLSFYNASQNIIEDDLPF